MQTKRREKGVKEGKEGIEVIYEYNKNTEQNIIISSLFQLYLYNYLLGLKILVIMPLNRLGLSFL